MIAHEKVKLHIADGREVEAIAPVIVSASRSTDLPAFYADWFFKRLAAGYSIWRNPFNGKYSYISYAKTRFIVFWSKNPKPLLKHLYKLKERQINCYIQFTLNDYEHESYEKNVPPLAERLATFQSLVSVLGKGHVIWRNDPLLLTDKISVQELLRRAERIGDALQGYTEKMTFSFVDIARYAKVKNNLAKFGVNYIEWTDSAMQEFATGIASLNQKWQYQLATCAEKMDLSAYGIEHSRCVDDELIARFAYEDKELMDYLGLEVKHRSQFLSAPAENCFMIADNLYCQRQINREKLIDKGQRKACGCIISKDIGQYNTCPHLCVYCYANPNLRKPLPDAETMIYRSQNASGF